MSWKFKHKVRYIFSGLVCLAMQNISFYGCQNEMKPKLFYKWKEPQLSEEKVFRIEELREDVFKKKRCQQTRKWPEHKLPLNFRVWPIIPNVWRRCKKRTTIRNNVYFTLIWSRVGKIVCRMFVCLKWSKRDKWKVCWGREIVEGRAVFAGNHPICKNQHNPLIYGPVQT